MYVRVACQSVPLGVRGRGIHHMVMLVLWIRQEVLIGNWALALRRGRGGFVVGGWMVFHLVLWCI